MITTYYIDGRKVYPLAAKVYFMKGYNMHTHLEMSSQVMWAGRNTEEGRELIHNITGIQDQGGLEIIMEEG